MDIYKITDSESLNILLRTRERAYGRFIVEVENMDENTKRKFENDLNKFHASCGCSTGNYFLITTLILFTAYHIFTGQSINNWKMILQGFFVIAIAAVVGKFIGKLMDGFKFKKTIEKLSYELL